MKRSCLAVITTTSIFMFALSAQCHPQKVKQVQRTLSGTWVWEGLSATGDDQGCTAGAENYTIGNQQAGSTYKEIITIKQQGNELLIPDTAIRWSTGGYILSRRGRISGNQITIDVIGGGFKVKFTGTLSSDGRTITGTSFCTFGRGSATATLPSTLTRKGETKRVSVWLNTFIPTRVAEIRIEEKRLGCLHADNRGFSSDLNASSRTQQVIELEVETDGNQVTNIAPITTDGKNRVGESYFADCRTGNRLDRLPSGGASIRDIRNSWQQQGNNVVVKFAGRIGLPLLPSCPIDFDMNVLIDPIAKTYRITGGRDGFPAYEAYLQVDNNLPKSILNYNPIPLGINPVSSNGLCMWDKRNPVSGSGKF